MYFLFFLLISCATKVVDLTPSGSVCIDSVQFNLIRDGCKLINQSQKQNGLELACMKSKNGGEWTKRVFYITHANMGMEQMENFHPLCADKDIIVYDRTAPAPAAAQ